MKITIEKLISDYGFADPQAAVRHCVERGWELDKLPDRTEGHMWDVPQEYALQVCAEDPSRIYVDIDDDELPELGSVDAVTGIERELRRLDVAYTPREPILFSVFGCSDPDIVRIADDYCGCYYRADQLLKVLRNLPDRAGYEPFCDALLPLDDWAGDDSKSIS